MINVVDVLRRLLMTPQIGRTSLSTVPTDQGVYVLWLRDVPICLKVGIAGPRRGKGLRERIKNHFSSSADSSVLARHLAADTTSRWCNGRDFTSRFNRQSFLAEDCYFQALPVHTETRRELEQLEAALIARLRPLYIGRVGQLRA